MLAITYISFLSAFTNIGTVLHVEVRNMRELAAAVRSERKRLGLSQAAVAERTGVGRDWIIGLEKGKPTAEIGLVLRTLRTLGLTVQLGSKTEARDQGRINLDELLGDSPENPWPNP